MVHVLQRLKGSTLFPGAAKGPTGVIKSVLDTSRTDGGRRDEIFVDIVEKVSCTFNASGYIQTSQIDGAIQVDICSASCCGTGNPLATIILSLQIRSQSEGVSDPAMHLLRA